jgi:hypothetical protein
MNALDRVLGELSDLEAKTVSLNGFLESDAAQNLSKEAAFLLAAQSLVMLQYTAILHRRIETWKAI